MNVFKKISVAASILAVATLSSCSDKGYWDQAPAEQGLSFQSANYNETIAPGANEIVIPLRRSINTTDETVNITFTPGAKCPADITVPTQAVFKAGSNTADLVITVADAQVATSYSGTIAFEGDPSYSGISEIKLNCPVDYNWISLGTGTFYDMFVMSNVEEGYPVEIRKADGYERYRVVAPYKAYYASAEGKEEWGDWIASSGPDNLDFWETSDGKLTYNSFATGLLYDGPGGTAIGAYNWAAFGAGSGYTGDDDRWYSPGFAVLSPVYYVNGVGGWGQIQYSIQIELPE